MVVIRQLLPYPQQVAASAFAMVNLAPVAGLASASEGGLNQTSASGNVTIAGFRPWDIYTTELRKIARDHSESTTSSAGGDQQIIAADRQAPALQGRSDVSGVIEREYFDLSGEALHLISIVFRPRGFGRFVQKFGEHNRGDAKAVSLEVEPLPDL